jgi:transcriptional regulator with XRE-family HTH domain
MQKIGKKIEAKLREKGITISEFARRISTNRNNVYDIFQRESIDTSLLKKISKVLDYDFFSYLSQSPASQIQEQEINYVTELELLKEKNKNFETEIDYLKKLLSDKEKIIRLLESAK